MRGQVATVEKDFFEDFAGYLDLNFTLGPTVGEFTRSDAAVCVLISPAGEGKTFGAVVALPIHAQKCNSRLQTAIIRDTHENIKNTTVRSIEEVFQDYPGILRWRNDYKQLTIRSDPPVDCDLFGIDDAASLSKLQGGQWGCIWLEEPAAQADRSNAGLSEEVYNTALLRCARQKGTRPRLQITMNPADESHWTFKRFILEPEILPEFPNVIKKVWQIPYGENKDLNPAAREFAMAAYKDDPAAYARYVLGRFSPVQYGIAVTQNYRQDRHMMLDRDGKPYNLVPGAGLESFAFFDSWSNPACVLGQITPSRRLVFLDTLRLEASDLETLLETQVMPLLESPRWYGKAKAWRIGGDRSMLNMDQSSRNRSAARVVERYFPGCGFEPGPKTWNEMEPHLSWILTHNNADGDPLVLLSGDNKLLHRALGGGWHYPKNNMGERSGNLPVKNASSHVGDSWANAVCRLHPSQYIDKKLVEQFRKKNEKLRQRARGYITTNRGKW